VWYFYTHRSTIWKVIPGNWASDALLRFVFSGQPQDFGRYINHPYWFDRYGDHDGVTVYRFDWVRFYATVADNLLAYRHDRSKLIAWMHSMASSVDGIFHLKDKSADGSIAPLSDIDPFSAMGTFNRGLSSEKRRIIAKGFQSFLHVHEEVPASFSGIPILENRNSLLFRNEKDRDPGDIDALWDVFYEAILFADGGDDYDSAAFIQAYDKAASLPGVGWNLTMGLFWIRPWKFTPLDRQSREYISDVLEIPIPVTGPKGRCTAEEYLFVNDAVAEKLLDENSPVHSIPVLSTIAGGWEAASDVSTLVAARLESFKALVLRSFPGFSGVADSSFQSEEIEYKRKAVDEIGVMLSESVFTEMMADGKYSELIKILRSAGGKANLLYLGTPAKGDLAPLCNDYPDEAGLCSAFYDLIWGTGESFVRLSSFYEFVASAGLPVKWATATYYLFFLHPSTEMFVKPDMMKWLLDYFSMPMLYESRPSGQLYKEILVLCREIASQLSLWGVTDMIDVHSLIWAAYRAPAKAEVPEIEMDIVRVDSADYEGKAELAEVNPFLSLDEIHSSTGYNREWIGRAVAAVSLKKQAVLYGPPGTGKTYLAKMIASHLIGGGFGFAEVVQFHPSYSYEDFIEGLRPVASSAGVLEYKMIDGRFMEFCSRARSVSGACVLVVDEINRANLSRVFGELMYLLEYREETIPLAGGSSFSIPSNVFIIGTMNTADRSIALVDHALRRRFAFIHMKPDYSVLGHYHTRMGTGFSPAGLVDVLLRVNKAIEDRNYFVGVSFFLHDDIEERIENVWKLEIEPYLEEYFFDRPDTAELFAWSVVCKEITGRE
jgi:MoxR-like ATPase